MKLVDNALHSFQKAFEKLILINNANTISNEEYELKDIILGFHHSFEIFFKVLLKNEDGAFIYEDVQKFFEQEFQQRIRTKCLSGICRTVSYIQAFKRLYVLYNIKDDGTLFPSINKLNELRNELTHREAKLNHEELKLLIANILYYLLPLFDTIYEFKKFSIDKEVEDNLKKLKEFNDIWKLKNYLFLVNYNEEETNDIDKQRYKKLLCDFGITYDTDDEIIAHMMCNFKSFLLWHKQSLKNFVYKDNPKVFISAVTKLLLYRLECYQIVTLLSSEDDDLNIEKEFKIDTLNLQQKYHLWFIVKSLSDVLNICEEIKGLSDIEIVFSFKEINDVFFKMKISKFIKTVEKQLNEENIEFGNKKYITNAVESAIDDTLYGEVMDLLWDKYAGEFGEISTIDRIDEVCISGEYMICNIANTNNFSVIYEVAASTEWYSDHDYYSNGTVYEIIKQNISITSGNINVDNSKII